jgi:cytochrome c oxidase subunit 2
MSRRLFPDVLERTLGKLGVVAVLLCGGCGGEHFQSVLHPASDDALRLARLTWFLVGTCTVVFLIVMGLLFAALSRRAAQREAPLGDRKFILVGGVAFPTVVLFGILLYSLGATARRDDRPAAVTIRVEGHMWWWDVRYPDSGIVTANEIVIPAGRPVDLELVAADVVHSFWVPNLNGKMDLIPGHVNRFRIEAARPGIFRGQCAEFCGVQHALMAFVVEAVEPEAFARWVEARRVPPPAPVDPVLRRGRDVFFEAACANCHAIAGTAAVAVIGPDLTHMGSRRTLGAGTLPNDRATLAGWIANPQALKPGNRMPRSYLEPDDLHALVDYLLSLK